MASSHTSEAVTPQKPLQQTRPTPIQTQFPISSMSAPLTPPQTPVSRKPAHPSSFVSRTRTTPSKTLLSIEQTPTNDSRHVSKWQKTQAGRMTANYSTGSLLGDGSMSRVHAADLLEPETPSKSSSECQKHSLGSLGQLTPPASPSRPSCRGPIIAVKTSRAQMFNQALWHEGRVLTYLHSFEDVDQHVVPFHGLDHDRNAILLSMAASDLQSWAMQRARSPSASPSTKTMFEPIVGIDLFQQISRDVVGALAWLHDKDCVHGDIKATNFLVFFVSGESRPHLRLCDFASARILDAEQDDISNDAMTTYYASPELHARFGAEKARPTTASDVWAAAVTLLLVATGEEPFAIERNSMRKSMMAKNGWVLDAYRNGDQGSRVMPGRLADKVVRNALRPKAEDRITSRDWLQAISELS